MKKLITFATSTYVASQILVGRAFAALKPPPSITGLNEKENIKEGIVFVIEKILDFILIIAVLYVVIAGIRLIVSGGDDGAKDKAKLTIIYVIAGIIVILLARVIVTAANTVLSA